MSVDHLSEQFNTQLNELHAAILRPNAVTNAALSTQFLSPPRGRIQDRLAIYQHAYRQRLHDSLAQTFERVHTWLGDDAFESLALNYLAAHPSTHENLRYFGDEFAPFCQTAYPNDAEITELAALDWALRNVFDAADTSPLALQDIDPTTDWSCTTLCFDPAMRDLIFSMNTLALWHRLDQNHEPPPCTALTSLQPVMVWRKGFQPHFKSIHPQEYECIKFLRQGISFAAACERIAPALGDEGALIGQWLHSWFNEGWIVGLKTV